jgi:membrane protease YdiL (CAAX protease family)
MPRRVVILIGLALALVVPLLPGRQLVEHIPGLSPLLGREVFAWGLTAIVLLYVLVIEHRPLSSIGLRGPTWKTFAFGIGTGVFTLVVIGGVMQFLLVLLHLTRNASALQTIVNTPYWYRVLLVTRAAVTEEILFRGYGIERIEELTGNKYLAGLITLAIFTFAHLSHWGWTQLIIAGGAGLVLTILYIWRRDLGANMIAHWVTDAVSILTVH